MKALEYFALDKFLQSQGALMTKYQSPLLFKLHFGTGYGALKSDLRL